MRFLLSSRYAFATAVASVGLLASAGQIARADTLSLGEASNFGVLAGSTVTNTGPTVVFGNVGVTPGTAITGFPPGTITDGSLHSNDALAQQAQSDLGTAYNFIAAETPTQNLTGQDLGSRTLSAGVYSFASSAQLTGPLILDAHGDVNARFDFQIGSTLTTASSSVIELVGGASANNVFWQVGSSATLGTGTTFAGNILALTSITATTGATDIGGRLLARNGAVTLDSNIVGASRPVPEAGTIVTLSTCCLAGLGMVRRRVGGRR